MDTHSTQPHSGLPRAERLRSPADFSAVFADGQWAACKSARIVLHRRPPPQGGRRVGISVSRRFGNAVARNRFKRRIREAFRRIKHQLPEGIDCVFLPSKFSPDPGYAELLNTIPGLIQDAIKRLERRRSKPHKRSPNPARKSRSSQSHKPKKRARDG